MVFEYSFIFTCNFLRTKSSNNTIKIADLIICVVGLQLQSCSFLFHILTFIKYLSKLGRENLHAEEKTRIFLATLRETRLQGKEMQRKFFPKRYLTQKEKKSLERNYRERRKGREENSVFHFPIPTN